MIVVNITAAITAFDMIVIDMILLLNITAAITAFDMIGINIIAKITASI